MFFVLAQFAMQKNTLLHSGVTVGKEYMVRFKVLCTEFAGTLFTSVLHFTTGKDGGHGCRIPAVFFMEKNGKRQLRIAAQSTDGEDIVFKHPNIVNNVWIDVVIQQTERAGRYVIELILNDEIIGSMVNHDPYVFENVKVYVSDPWYPAQPGFLKDFSFH